jgi:hypothetical protein
MKPAVPSAVPYPDMRSWQRLGVELWGQRSRRFNRYAEPRGKAESASTKADRSQGWMGTTNTCERLRTRRNVYRAKCAEWLEPKGTRQGMAFVLWAIMDTNAAGAQDGSAPSGNSCGTG